MSETALLEQCDLNSWVSVSDYQRLRLASLQALLGYRGQSTAKG
jgi:hypothetical protein